MIRYAPNFNKIYKFAEYGDYDNYFVELCYVVERGEFVSRIGAPLANHTAIDGNPIFRAENIELAKYKLLNEQVEPLESGAVDFVKVVETYGYAPSRNYTTYTAEPVKIFGLQDPSAFFATDINTSGAPNIYNAPLDQFTLSLSDASSLSVGDMVECRLTGSGVFYDGYSASVAIIAKSDNTITTPAFTVTFLPPEGSGTTYSKQDTINILNALNPNFWRGSRQIVRRASTRKPRVEITNVRNEIVFFQTLPQIDLRLVVSLGNDETDTITADTTPSVNDWKQSIANGEYYNIQDSAIDIVFPNALYKRTTKQVACR